VKVVLDTMLWVSAKADYLVTADALLLELGKVQRVEIVSVRTLSELLPQSF
jgi:predicted nucleic acid-binding protein